MRAPRLNCVLINFNFSGIIAALNQLRFCVGFSTYCSAQFKHKLLNQTVMVQRPSIYHICQLVFLSPSLSISSSCSCSYNDPNKHLFCCRLFLLLFFFYFMLILFLVSNAHVRAPKCMLYFLPFCILMSIST